MSLVYLDVSFLLKQFDPLGLPEITCPALAQCQSNVYELQQICITSLWSKPETLRPEQFDKLVSQRILSVHLLLPSACIIQILHLKVSNISEL